MAALSCYQPCRSHLAQPARCLDEDPTPPLTLRRRQLIQRCLEPRPPLPRDPPPDVSIRKTREELARSATQPAPYRPLNVESGWSKVEEVRKKFEGAAATVTFSRSFESPPRRRLADSLFASFKLPRRRESSGMSSGRTAAPQPKRKSAVELLAETKAFYVKSETVLDRKQELPLRVSSGLSQAIAAGGCHLVSSGTLNNDACCNPFGSLGGRGARRVSGEALQSTLRRLLDDERGYSPPIYAIPHKVRPPDPPALSGTSSSGTSGSKGRNRPRSLGEARVFFPDSFVVPRQRTADVLYRTTYSIPSPHSSPDSLNPELSAEQIGTISPPAQYARYTRSNSHCQSSVREEECANINSHKSLPDLHAQATTYTDHVVSGTETLGRPGRRRRHSGHHRTASCSSKGTRSNHSSLISSCDAFSEHPSPGEENYQYNSRCGSSFARDSGGSSGHYTQRSAPTAAHVGDVCRPSPSLLLAPPQFQDGAPSPPPAHPPPREHDNVHIHFQASAPPPQFQDEPLYEYDCYRPSKHRHDYKYNRYPEDTVIKSEPRPRPRPDDTQNYVNTAQICPGPEEVTSPLGTFKRQRCLRYKQRRPRPILRSKSDISDRYRRTEGRSPASAPCEADDSEGSGSSSPDRLRQFFERLGLEPRLYDTVIASPNEDSPVFFSSCSSVDSNQLPDYTVQGPPQKQIYRNTEPPSVVERNARIVKWLCQCRRAAAP